MRSQRVRHDWLTEHSLIYNFWIFLQMVYISPCVLLFKTLFWKKHSMLGWEIPSKENADASLSWKDRWKFRESKVTRSYRAELQKEEITRKIISETCVFLRESLPNNKTCCTWWATSHVRWLDPRSHTYQKDPFNCTF